MDIITVFANDRALYFGIENAKIISLGERQADFGKIHTVKNVPGDKMVAVNDKFEMFTLAYKNH